MSLATENLRELIGQRDADAIRKLCKTRSLPAIVDALLTLTPEEARYILLSMRVSQAGKVLVEIPEDYIQKVITDDALVEMAPLLNEMESDDLTDVMQSLEESVRATAMSMLKPQKVEIVKALMKYEDGTVGSIMRSEFLGVPAGAQAGEALKILRERGISPTNIHNVYLLDRDGKLKGLIPLSRTILQEPDSILLEKAETSPITIDPNATVEEAIHKVRDFDLVVLPVVRSDGKLVGVVTGDDILDVEEEETTLDFHRMAPISKGLSLRTATMGQMLLARSPWLVILVFMNIFSGAGIAYFEETIEAMVALVFFLPLLIDSGGNAGSQSATLMVRAIAVGDVRMKDWARLFSKEISTALALGVLMAFAVASVAAFRAPEILMPVALTMVCTVVFGSLVGMSLPFLLTKFKLDPATASAPLITSIADIGGVLIYFSIATWWLGPMIAEAAQMAATVTG